MPTIGEIDIALAHPVLEAPVEAIARHLQDMVDAEGRQIKNLSVVLTDHGTVQDLNKKHLGRSYQTDVLAFDLSDPDSSRVVALPIDGEIYIDLDTAFERAPEFGSTYEKEILRYAIHGLLHLLGYCDDAAEQRDEMKRLENYYLNDNPDDPGGNRC